MPGSLLRWCLDGVRGFRTERRLCCLMPDPLWRERCIAARVPIEEASVSPDGTIGFQRLPGLKLPRTPGGERVVEGYELLVALVERSGATVRWSPERDAVNVTINGCVYPADCWEELYILHEIHLAGDYDLMPSCLAVLVDVGANVGFTSIFLAGLLPDLLVEAFEPVPVNYHRALRNVDANPAVAPRISVANLGLSSADGIVTMTSELARRGRSSFVIDRRCEPIGPVEEVQAVVRCATDVLREVRARHPGRFVMVKLDCEGSEYPILEQLHASGALTSADAYMMEWHRRAADGKGPDHLRNLLVESGFHCYMRSRMDVGAVAGMAVAIRSA